MKTIFATLLILVLSQTFAVQRVGEIINPSGENLRTPVMINGEEVLQVIEALPQKTVFKYRTESTNRRPYILNSNNQVVRSKGNYLGSLIIQSAEGLSQQRISELNKKKIFLFEKSTAILHVSLPVQSERGALLGIPTTNLFGKEIEKFLTVQEFRLPKDSIISVRPENYMPFPRYISEVDIKTGEDVKVKKSGARYLGPIQIKSAPGVSQTIINQLNQQDLYIYEWHLDKTELIKALYNEEIPRGQAWIQSDFAWDSVNTKKGWSHHTANFILSNGTDLLKNPPIDVEDFCPAYNDIDNREKAIFWVHLLNAIAKKESLFDPGVKNDESGFGKNSNDVISRGLLQISYESSQNRNYQRQGCPIDKVSDLHEPIKNLQCGVAIFNHLTEDMNCISCRYPENDSRAGKFAGISRYWSTLRTPYTVYCKTCKDKEAKLGFRDQIIEKTSKTKVCRK